MATTITSVEDALELYSNNLDFDSLSQAKNALKALRYLKVHRAQAMSHVGSSLNYSEIDSLITRLEDEIDKKKAKSYWTAAKITYQRSDRR